MDLRKEIRKTYEDSKMSLSEVAEQFGMKEAEVFQSLYGKGQMSLNAATKYADFFGYEITYSLQKKKEANEGEKQQKATK